MIDVQNYIINGRVEREKIALDIRYREISHSDLEKLVSNPEIQKAFVGKNYAYKKSNEHWNKEYLEELSYVAIAESFNKDYLMYLEEVAAYVHSKEHSRKIVVGKMAIIVIILVIIVFLIIMANKGKKEEQQQSIVVEALINLYVHIEEVIL